MVINLSIHFWSFSTLYFTKNLIMVVDNPKSKTLKYAIIDPNNLYKPNSEIPIKVNKIGTYAKLIIVLQNNIAYDNKVPSFLCVERVWFILPHLLICNIIQIQY